GRITSGRGGRHSERNDQHQHDKYHDRSRKRRHEPLPAPPRSVNNTPPLLFYRHRAHHTRGNNPLCTATTTPTPLHPTPIIWKAATRKARMRILLVDNHGPYTINLCRLIATVVGSTPTILTNDDKHWDHIDTNTFDALIISPRPGHPQNPHALGHAGTAPPHAAHAALAPAPRSGPPPPTPPTHHPLSTGLPHRFPAGRHRSLAGREPLPTTPRATAWAEDNVVMGLEHRNLPRW